MANVARWNQARFQEKITRAAQAASDGKLAQEVEKALEPVAQGISSTIRASGRGGTHNADFANIETRVWIAASGRLNAQIGWLNPDAYAHERGNSGRLWYQYQDAGFKMFPNSVAIDIPGVLANIDRRENTLEAIDRAMSAYVDDIKKEVNR